MKTKSHSMTIAVGVDRKAVIVDCDDGATMFDIAIGLWPSEDVIQELNPPTSQGVYFVEFDCASEAPDENGFVDYELKNIKWSEKCTIKAI